MSRSRKPPVGLALFVWLLAGPSIAHAQSELEKLAPTLAPGTWAPLTTSNIDATLGAQGNSGCVTGYADDMEWDPGSAQGLFIGGDHNDDPIFVRYAESSNAWDVLSAPWLPGPTMHGYNHNAIDVSRGELYHRPFASHQLHRYEIASGNWTTIDPPFANENPACCDAIEYFPELDSLLWVKGYGEVWLYERPTDSWSMLDTLPAGSTWNIAEYNPVHKLVVFALAESLYKLTSDKQITPLKAIPIDIYDGSGYNGVLTVDPLSGDYLALTATSRQFYTYDVTSDAWQLAASQPSDTISGLSDTMMVGTPVSTHGVNFFAYCYAATSHVMVYKHAPGTGIPFDGGASGSGGAPSGGGGNGNANTGGNGNANTGAAAGSAGVGAAAAASSGAADDSSCGCRLVRDPRERGSAWWVVGLAGAFLLRRCWRNAPTSRGRLHGISEL